MAFCFGWTVKKMYFLANFPVRKKTACVCGGENDVRNAILSSRFRDTLPRKTSFPPPLHQTISLHKTQIPRRHFIQVDVVFFLLTLKRVKTPSTGQKILLIIQFTTNWYYSSFVNVFFFFFFSSR